MAGNAALARILRMLSVLVVLYDGNGQIREIALGRTPCDGDRAPAKGGGAFEEIRKEGLARSDPRRGIPRTAFLARKRAVRAGYFGFNRAVYGRNGRL